MVNNERDTELSSEARRIIADAKGVDEPTAEDRARVRALWLSSIAAAGGVSAFGQAAHAAGGTAWGLKALGLALAVMAGAAGLYLGLSPTDPPASDGVSATADLPGRGRAGAVSEPPELSVRDDLLPQPAVVGSSPAAHEAAAASEAVDRAVVDRAVQPSESRHAPVVGPARTPLAPAAPASLPLAVVAKGPSSVASAAHGAPAVEPEAGGVPGGVPGALPARPGGQLAEELAQLSEIRGSVQQGNGGRALELLTVYQSRFEHPVLGMEAAALRVDALCQSGQRDAARASAQVFQDRWPGSPLEQRVRSACP